MKRSVILLAVALALGTGAAAQSPGLGGAIATGQVGERYDGYLGVVSTPSPLLIRQVNAINIRRRNLYIQLAERRNVTPDLVGIATGCQLLSQLGPGEAYMLQDGTWRRHSPGERIPLPDYCH